MFLLSETSYKGEMNLIEFVCSQYQYSEFVANGLIMSGNVLVNDEVCLWVKYVLKEHDKVRIRKKKKEFVTRSGYKLQAAIEKFHIDMKNAVALDIGASEGGFTDCLLKHGAHKVYAVDVAYGILNYKLRTSPQVVVLERKNARYLTLDDVSEKVDYITTDISFISLSKVIPNCLKFLKEGGMTILLYKPQFELNKECLGKNGNPKERQDVVDAIVAFVQLMKTEGLFINSIINSPIKGNSGNREYILLGSKRETTEIETWQIEQCILNN